MGGNKSPKGGTNGSKKRIPAVLRERSSPGCELGLPDEWGEVPAWQLVTDTSRCESTILFIMSTPDYNAAR